jgi:hypothetical protein
MEQGVTPTVDHILVQSFDDHERCLNGRTLLGKEGLIFNSFLKMAC